MEYVTFEEQYFVFSEQGGHRIGKVVHDGVWLFEPDTGCSIIAEELQDVLIKINCLNNKKEGTIT
jgi:hypothetical protein